MHLFDAYPATIAFLVLALYMLHMNHPRRSILCPHFDSSIVPHNPKGWLLCVGTL